MIETEVIVIGGGAAGLMAAARLAESGVKTILIEKGRQCGRKLLITGKGRCNITNYTPWNDFSSHIHPDSNFFKSAFYNFTCFDTVTYFEDLGLKSKVERGNRVFPQSDMSVDVRDALFSHIVDCGGEIMCGCTVTGVNLTERGAFIVSFVNGSRNSQILQSKFVIVATGGLSYPTTGSTGDGYHFAEGTGHSIVPTFPALTALKPSFHDKRLEDFTLRNVKVDLLIDSNEAQSEFGEITFTDGGIEGALGFRVSRKGVKALIDGRKVELVIDLKPALTVEQLSSRITQIISEYQVKGGRAENKRTQIKRVLKQLLPSQIIDSFIDSNIIYGLSLANLPLYLKRWHFDIVGYVGYERAVVTVGGVSLDDISRKTMESKRVNGLYFAGEVLNLDGDTGGYNLQIAFSTASLAAKSISLRINNK